MSTPVGSGAAIVTTLRGAEAYLEDFVRYHAAIGFDRLYLFFDDPRDPAFEAVASREGVTAIRNDRALHETWASIAREHSPMRTYYKYRDREVMGRQGLNVKVAIDRARADGIRWLLHIDVDELFVTRAASVADHFAMLDALSVEHVVYVNHEGVPERLHNGRILRDVTLFKTSPYLLDRYHQDWFKHRFPARRAYFNYYTIGKAAARITPDLLPWPLGMHAFYTASMKQWERPVARWRARLGVSSLRLLVPSFEERLTLTPAVMHQPFVLHYPVCGVDELTKKYQILGPFRDRWFGRGKMFPFHIRARNIVASGDSAAIERLYREEVMLPPDEIEGLVRLGILQRVEDAAAVLAGPRSLPSRGGEGAGPGPRAKLAARSEW